MSSPPPDLPIASTNLTGVALRLSTPRYFFGDSSPLRPTQSWFWNVANFTVAPFRRSTILHRDSNKVFYSSLDGVWKRVLNSLVTSASSGIPISVRTIFLSSHVVHGGSMC